MSNSEPQAQPNPNEDLTVPIEPVTAPVDSGYGQPVDPASQQQPFAGQQAFPQQGNYGQQAFPQQAFPQQGYPMTNGAYGAPGGYANPGATYQPVNGGLPGTNSLAVIALVLGIVGVPIVPIVLGHLALSQIKTTGGEGRGIALAGLILGYVGIAGWIVGLLLLFVMPFLMLGILGIFSAAGTAY